jgi:hypothetical protein
MPWIIGIDEAGYGPNLGPLVMTSVACWLPPDQAERDLWTLLQTAVRRPAEPNDGRLIVGDSKLVYSTQRGLRDLETSVLAILAPAFLDARIAHLLEAIALQSLIELRAEPWYSGELSLPTQASAADCRAQEQRLRKASTDRRLVWGAIHSVIVCPGRFNQCLERWGSKGAVLGEALAGLLRANIAQDQDEDGCCFLIDKHGGRNTYAAMLQHALPDGIVVAREEGAARSVYDVLGLPRTVRIVVQPRADVDHFCVALASMFSKYVRELLMREFNDFWLRHLPDLKPTAGYPGDALRFIEAIRPVMERLGISDASLWRNR